MMNTPDSLSRVTVSETYPTIQAYYQAYPDADDPTLYDEYPSLDPRLSDSEVRAMQNMRAALAAGEASLQLFS